MDDHYKYLKSVERYLFLQMLQRPEDQELFNQWTQINLKLDAELCTLLKQKLPSEILIT